MKWTEAQESIIEARDSNLLVSAAAGSGKTAVLVARIIGRITDEQNPLSLDRLLVMTFTRAAAAEMRERIGKALRERLAQDPGNRFLQLQKAILPRAQITTIDGFCQFLIRQQYQALDIDPGFRVGDEGELRLMRGDLLKALTEEAYAAGEPAFLRFVEAYAGNRLDTKVSELIEQVHQFLQAAPWPRRFLAEQKEECRLEAEGRLSETGWMRQLLEEMRICGADFQERLLEVRELCGEEDGPAPYLPAVEELLAVTSRLAQVETYEELYAHLSAFAPPKLKAVRGKAFDAEKKAAAKAVIDAARKFLDGAKASYASLSWELLQETAKGSAEAVGTLLDLAGRFMERFEAAKREKNLVDFSDMEHLALRLLYEEREEDSETEPVLKTDRMEAPGDASGTREVGSLQFSALADQLARNFDEILIDEYQDSNGLQEALVAALSAERFGKPDVFMVGDVKQSIYRFRLAEPTLFMEKYDSYRTQGPHRKIELAQNFRSRASVLAAVNDVFFPLMQRSVGGIDYNRQTALHAGAAYPAHGDCGTELDLISLKGSDEETDAKVPEAAEEEEQETLDTKDAYEARWIAQRIRSLVCPEAPEQTFQVTDGETGQLRPARFRDIVILLRAPGRRVEQLVDSLGAFGIPAYAETTTGYFHAIEVEVVLSCLNIIDNPHQDIALSAAMKSPIGGFSDEDLARLRTAFCHYAEGKTLQLQDLYEALKYAAAFGASGALPVGAEIAGLFAEQGEAEHEKTEHGKTEAAALPPAETAVESSIGLTAEPPTELPPELCRRCRAFLDWLTRFRELSQALPVYRLLHQLYLETGYYEIVSAMPLGEMRRKNLDMLLRQAEDYAATSYRGLFNFVRYVEMLKQYDTDYGEAKTVSEQDDIVRITSIHKSKGLEYPIVILAGLGRQFNQEDLKASIVVDSQLGLGADYIDGARRLRFPGLKKAVIRAKRRRDNYGEELRVLYVAMTRAKEKLILTASVQSAAKKLEKYAAAPVAFGTPAEERGNGAGPEASLKLERQSGAEPKEVPGGQSGRAVGDESAGKGCKVPDDRAEQLAEKVPQSSLLEASSYLDWLLLSGAAIKGSIALRLIGPEDIADAEIAAAVQERDDYGKLVGMALGEVPDPDYERELCRALAASYPYLEETKLKPKISVSELKRVVEASHDKADGSAFWEAGGILQKEDSVLPETDCAGFPAQDIDYDDGAFQEMEAERRATEDDWSRMNGTGNENDCSCAMAAGEAQAGSTGAAEALAGEAAGKAQMKWGAGGSRAGTAFHRFVELLDFAALGKLLQACDSSGESGKTGTVWPLFSEQADGQLQFAVPREPGCTLAPLEQFLTSELKRMEADGRFPSEDMKKLNHREIVRFLESPLAAEMAEAAGRNALWREQHFMIGLPARELTPGAASGELQLLQGIMDAYFMDKKGGLVLVDYKTDRVEHEEILKARYGLQLRLYAKALCQLLDRPVQRTLIYSTKLGREILVKTGGEMLNAAPFRK